MPNVKRSKFDKSNRILYVSGDMGNNVEIFCGEFSLADTNTVVLNQHFNLPEHIEPGLANIAFGIEGEISIVKRVVYRALIVLHRTSVACYQPSYSVNTVLVH